MSALALKISNMDEKCQKCLQMAYSEVLSQVTKLNRHSKPVFAQISLWKLIDKTIGDALAETGATIACKAGCSYCCYLKVDVHASEAILISEFVKSKLPEETKKLIIKRAEENWKLIEPMNEVQHMTTNLPCPFLVDGICSIYSVRPGACRNFHSADVQICKDFFNNPKNLNDNRIIAQETYQRSSLVIQGGIQAFKKCEYDIHAYDINAAFLEAINNKHIANRWSDKKNALSKNARSKSDHLDK